MKRIAPPILLLVLVASSSALTSPNAVPFSYRKEAPRITQAGEMLTVDVELVNTGNRPLTIERVRPGCGCTIATFTESSISPNQSGVVSLKMDLRRLDRIISQEEFTGGFRNVEVTADVFGDFAQDTSAKFLPIRVRHRVRMPVQLATPPGLVVGPLDPDEQQSEHQIPVLVDAGVCKIAVESLIAGCRIDIDVHKSGVGQTGESYDTDGRHTELIRVTCDHAAIAEVMKGDSSIMRLITFHCSDEQGQAFPEVKLPLTVSVPASGYQAATCVVWPNEARANDDAKGSCRNRPTCGCFARRA